jgi:hypothetical protein
MSIIQSIPTEGKIGARVLQMTQVVAILCIRYANVLSKTSGNVLIECSKLPEVFRCKSCNDIVLYKISELLIR